MANFNGTIVTSPDVISGSVEADGVIWDSLQPVIINNIVGGVTTYYRGRFGGAYVYSVDAPPGGATDIVIVGRIAS